MSKDAELRYWLWLSSIEGMEAAAFHSLIEAFGSAEAAASAKTGDERFNIIPSKLRQRLFDSRTREYTDALITSLKNLGIAAVPLGHSYYPEQLSVIDCPPPVLYVRGRLPMQLERAVTVVGCRLCSQYGYEVATMLGRDLSRAGVTVVSGLARGVDGFAHNGALQGSAPLVAVLGGGVDIVYPPEHRGLYDKVRERGTIISSYPPGTRPLGSHFPQRNRIMSALSIATVIVEAKLRSGALITVEHALNQSKDVFAVPGSIFSKTSEGVNKLLADGAIPLTRAEDLLEYYDWNDIEVHSSKREMPEEAGDGDRARIAGLLKLAPLCVDELVAELGLPPAKLNSLLTIMELDGIIRQLPGGLLSLSNIE